MTKKSIINYLKLKKVYDDQYEYLIDNFLYLMKLIKEAQADIDSRGITVSVNGSGTIFSSNTSVTVLHNSMRQMLAISKLLGLDYKSAEDLKLNVVVESDEFDD